MLSHYRLFTLTFRQARLDQLEPYVIAAEDVGATLSALRERLGWSEVFYLNTCNRVLFFFYESSRDETTVAEFQGALGLKPSPDLVAPLYLNGDAAVMHLYDVACSVDSMVVGEREILRQLRDSYLACHEGGHCGDHLRIVMQSAVAVAKQVYHETRIGQKPVSVVSLAAQRIRQQRLDAVSSRVILIGAGQTIWLVSKFLRKQGFREVTVYNRTPERAERLARTYPDGRARSLDELGQHRGGFDLLVVATGAAEPVVSRECMQVLLAGEPAGDKVVVDLSIPHDVDPEAVEAFDFTYIQIDGLRKLADANLAFRSNEVRAARRLIGIQLARFHESVQQRRVERAFSDLPQQVRAVRERALNEVFDREMKALDQPTRELIERMMNYMERKCVGIPMRAARRAVLEDEPELEPLPRIAEPAKARVA